MSSSISRFVTRAAGLLLILSGLASTLSATPVAPEIDPASASSAIALLAGAVLLARDKFGRR